MNTTPNRFIVSEPAQLVNFPAVVRPQPDRRRGDVADDADSLELPAIDSAMDLVADPTVQLPAELVEGVLHRGLKGVIGANSKARKTWILLDLALSVATGTKWWNWNTSGGRVLFVNFEIPKAFLKQRIQTLARRKQLTNYQNLDIWTLRGCSSNFTKLVEAMIDEVGDRDYSLIIIDPIYKALSGKDENRAGDIGEVCDLLERLAVRSNASVLYAHHFAKGNMAIKDPLDRMSGSGVFARDPDTLIIMTKHDNADCYTVDLVLRNLPEQPPFVVEWDYPVMALRDDLNPDRLKGKGGRPKQTDDSALLALLADGPLSHSEWKRRAAERLGFNKTAFDRGLRALNEAGNVEKDAEERWMIKPPAGNGTNPAPCSTSQPPNQTGQCQNAQKSEVSKPQAGG
jgi:hypothetical protein